MEKIKKLPKAQMEALKSRAKGFWWATLLRGIALILLGLAALFWPGLTFVTFFYFVAAFLLINGIIEIIAGIVAAADKTRASVWGWDIALGAVSIFVAFVLMRWPGLTTALLVMIFAIFLLIQGVVEIIAAFTAKMPSTVKVFAALSGIIAIIFGIILLVYPGPSILVATLFLGIFALCGGIITIAWAAHLRGVMKELK
jgi:uncharacterized membrane protein HdeD (DUF308 family)